MEKHKKLQDKTKNGALQYKNNYIGKNAMFKNVIVDYEKPNETNN